MDDKHKKIKKTLKTFGPILLIVGLALDAIGFIDFFSSFNGSGFPNLFWTLFIGLPLTGIGGWLTTIGYMKEIHKYTVDENKDVTKDYANYMMDGTRDEVVKTVDAIRGKDSNQVCPYCKKKIPLEASFCPNCGKALEKTCPECGEINDSDAKFCKKCGKRLF